MYLDNPKTQASEDLFNRGKFVHNLAWEILSERRKNSYVIGLYGRWGIGKTSIANFLKQKLLGDEKEEIISLYAKTIKAISSKGKLITQISLLLTSLFFLIAFFSPKISFVEFFMLTSLYALKAVVATFLIYIFGLSVYNIYNYFHKKDETKTVTFIEFSLWNISDKSNLFYQFFNILKSELKKHNNDIYTDEILSSITKYSKALANITANNSLGEFISIMQSDENLFSLKKQLSDALVPLNKKIIIVIDDIDRLPPEEVSMALQLVKAVGDLPNLVYILPLDKDSVVKSLNQIHNNKGEEYLEKIIQVPIHVPEIERSVLQGMLFKELDEIISKEILKDWAKIYGGDWGSCYPIIMEYIKTKRDLNIFLNNLKLSMDDDFQKEINLVDFIAFTALKTFDKKIYDFIVKNSKEVLGDDISFRLEDKDLDKDFAAKLQLLFDESKNPYVKNLLAELFPRISKLFDIYYSKYMNGYYNANKKICSSDHYEKYIKLDALSGEITEKNIDELINISKDNIKAFEQKLIDLKQDLFEDFITKMRLKAYAGNYKISDQNLEKALLNVADYKTQKDKSGMFETATQTIIDGFLTYDLWANEKEPYNKIKEAILYAEKSIALSSSIIRGLAGVDDPKIKLTEEQKQELKDILFNKIEPWMINDINDTIDDTKAVKGRLIEQNNYARILYDLIILEYPEDKLTSYIKTLLNKDIFKFLDAIKGQVISSGRGAYYQISKNSLKDLVAPYYNGGLEALKLYLENEKEKTSDPEILRVIELGIDGINGKDRMLGV